MYLKQTFLIIALGAMAMTAAAQASIDTQRQYLSGHGCDDMVDWDFYCTGGRNAGKWTKIGVPSCWELQGFCTYQYGMRFYGKATPEGIADEKGKYKYEFTLPQEWEGKQIELVFEAVMTDAKVTINGRKAGNGLHQGGFYRFTYDVSDRIFFGKHKNRLEVEVSKESSNSQMNMAERRADYWNFGGIFRPVFIVAKPAQNINRVAIDAKGDGHFMADCYLNRAIKGAKVKTEILDEKGKVVASNVADARNSDEAHVDFQAKAPKQWTAETPHLYTAVFTLQDAAGKTLHRERQKFGFRTIEYRASDGVYINGQKVIFKGVNRHSFRPETGRTLSKAKNIEDVKLIKNQDAEKMVARDLIGKGILHSGGTIPEFIPSVLLKEGDSLLPYGVNARIVELPGHTAGSIGIDVEGKYLIVGDALMNMMHPSLPHIYGDYDKMIDSARKIEMLGERTIYFGHGRCVNNRKWA